ncbi:MAG: DUF255 domain-containing protein [Planctomycetes bacterium]|nr:DUF255 domain-containing protein [Planctomycetota bacterium]
MPIRSLIPVLALASGVMAQEPSMSADVDGRNRLGDETSPYLLQHRNNPVHWWPWGPEAFAAARAADKPIFLSVGYSTCYWCHVMERESFENEAIAALMNELFVCIKLDREERPDVDDLYMSAVQIFQRGSGGWPMSVFLEPEGLKPFYGGTYYPPTDARGRPGFPSVLRQLRQAWDQNRDALQQQANQVAEAVAQQLAQRSEARVVGAAEIEGGIAQLLAGYDGTHGGFGRQRKFPMPANLDFLILAGWDRPPVRAAVIHTLDRMATGGLYDQVGGGFHRYTVDEKWLVPHFEKMLYDNGQLVQTYTEAYRRTADPFYARIIRETLDYVLREMTAPSGAFFSAQDAESNHREGESYIWTVDELTAALTAAGLGDDVAFALTAYGFDLGPNFQDPHHPEDGPKNVVFLVDRPDRQAKAMNMTVEAFEERLGRIDRALLAVRDRRDQPLTDDKILTAWNGLMIAGMADAGATLGEERYVEAARCAARYILTGMRPANAPDGLLRTSRNGRAKIDAFLEDYANMIHGLLALNRATAEREWLDAAVDLAAAARARFWDESGGAYYDTLRNQADLFVRIKSTYDGAVPSGNGVMLENLVDLHEATGEEAYLDDAIATVAALSGPLAQHPTGSVKSLIAVKRLVDRYPDRLAKPAGAPTPAPGMSGPVTVGVSEKRVTVADGATAELGVVLVIEPGFHVNAHVPGAEDLIALDIELVGAENLTLSVTYPPGERFTGPVGSMLVHHGTLTVPVGITRAGPVTPQARLLVTYQVCTDEVCLAPHTEVLAVDIVAP